MTLNLVLNFYWKTKLDKEIYNAYKNVFCHDDIVITKDLLIFIYEWYNLQNRFYTYW